MMIDEARGSLNEYILIPGIRGSNIYPNNIVKRFGITKWVHFKWIASQRSKYLQVPSTSMLRMKLER